MYSPFFGAGCTTQCGCPSIYTVPDCTEHAAHSDEFPYKPDRRFRGPIRSRVMGGGEERTVYCISYLIMYSLKIINCPKIEVVIFICLPRLSDSNKCTLERSITSYHLSSQHST